MYKDTSHVQWPWRDGKIPNEIQGSVKFVKKVVAYQEGQKGNSA